MEHVFAERARARQDLAANRAPAIVHGVLAESGERLPPGVRQDMEIRLGHDFSLVRVHADERAAASADAVFARAYAVGSHVVLGRSARLDDHGLLAHEMTHVARSSRALRSVPPDLQIAGPDDLEEHMASAASSRITSSVPPMLYRQAAPATSQAENDYVEQTIHFLRSSADFYSDPVVSVDQVLASRVLDGWYRAVVAQEGIARGLHAGPALTAELRAAYGAAVSVLLGRVAAERKVPLPELYRINRGRIFPWAWQEPHHMLPGIATPVPIGREADPVTGAVGVPTRGVSVSILPDGRDPKLKDRAETRLSLRYETPAFRWEAKGRQKVVTAIDPLPATIITIQTFYPQGIAPEDRSGYGRGTTPEDLAGATVGSRSGTVAFHEGQHGMDFVEFLRTHEPPVFGGRIGMTVPQFERASRQWMQAWKTYESQARAFSIARTDCSGVTIDEWEQKHAAGRRVKFVCPAQPHR